MTRRSAPRSVRLPAALLAVALLAAACGDGGDGQSGDGAPGGPRLTATLNGSGATFPQPFYEAVIAEFNRQQPGVTVNYGGCGAGKGRKEPQV